MSLESFYRGLKLAPLSTRSQLSTKLVQNLDYGYTMAVQGESVTTLSGTLYGTLYPVT